MITANKALGQHFLTDPQVAEHIVTEFLEGNPCKRVLEVGPGTGVLTQRLVSQPGIEFMAVEADARMINLLKRRFPELRSRLLHADFLQVDLNAIDAPQFSVIGNFPYNISSQILFKILETKERIPFAVGMFQKEVARRIAANHGNRQYGILSVLMQAFYEVEWLFEVPSSSFQPAPKVKSGVIRFTRKQLRPPVQDEMRFFAIVKSGFNQRRKMIRNSLASWIGTGLQVPDHLLQQRAEQLTVEEWIDLSNRMKAGPKDTGLHER